MNERTMIVTFLAGGVTGAALALLMAPQSGLATRERIARTVRDTTGSARDLAERVVQRSEEIGDEAARRAHEAGSALAGDRSRNTHPNGDGDSAT